MTPGPLRLGVEIGGTKLQVGLGRGDGAILALIRLPIRPELGATAILADLALAARRMIDDSGHPEVDAVGIGFGGPVEVEAGIVATSHQVAGWTGFPLADWAREAFGIATVSIENDADTAALGEALLGAGVGRSPLLYATIGSGIGGGLVVDGRIYRGGLGLGALELGHLRPDPTDPSATLESIASGWGIASHARRRVLETSRPGPLPADWLDREIIGAIDGQAVARAASAGDGLALAVLGEAASALGRSLGLAATLLAPSRIVLGGGVSLLSEGLWWTPVRAAIEATIFPPYRGRFDVVPAGLGEEVVVHGALALARRAVEGANKSGIGA